MAHLLIKTVSQETQMDGKAQPGYASQNVISSLVEIYVQFPCTMSDWYLIVKVSEEKETKIVRRQFFHLRAKDPTFMRGFTPPRPRPPKRQTATDVPKTLPLILTN